MSLWDKWLVDRQWTEGATNFEYYKIGYNRRKSEEVPLEAMVEKFIKLFQDNYDCVGPKRDFICQRCEVDKFADDFLKYKSEKGVEDVTK